MSEQLDLQAIKARCEKATPGPWEWQAIDPKNDGIGQMRGFGLEFLELLSSIGLCVLRPMGNVLIVEPCDKELIENARSDIPALLAEIERLNTELVKVKRREGDLLIMIAGQADAVDVDSELIALRIPFCESHEKAGLLKAAIDEGVEVVNQRIKELEG